MKKLFMLTIGFMTALVMSGCFSDETGTAGSVKLSLTDAPAVANFEKVKVTFGKIEISKEKNGEESAWITLNENTVTVDLRTLVNGRLMEFGVKELEEGTYNRIRLSVTEAKVTVGGVETTMVLSSKVIILATPFTVTAGETTELVVDFDLAHSIKAEGNGYILTPATRLAQVDMSGSIKGKVTLIPGAMITVTACLDGSTESVAGTVVDAEGNFMIGYLEPGKYDIYIEATVEGEVRVSTVADITIKAGVVIDRKAQEVTL